jgi:radical SAM superfamily enzyme YgiQ (UPF0313 family)
MLADPPRKEETYVYYHPTMGILYLMGAIRRGFSTSDVEVRYLQGRESLSSHLRQVEAFSPDIYGLSFKTPMARLAYKTLDAVKTRFPEIAVVAGGSHASVLGREVIERTAADACFRGECEETITRLIDEFANNRIRYDHLPGAVYRHRGQVLDNPVPPLKKDVDEYAWPAWDMVDIASFPGMPYKRGHPYAGVLVSRGCPYQCTFCSEPVWRIHGKPTYRSRSPEGIAAEVRYLHEAGVREIRLWCEEFNADQDWAIAVLTRIAELGCTDLFLNFNMRGDHTSPELADAMKAANVWLVNIGMESASDRTLRGVRKQVTTQEIEETCRIVTSRGIRIQGYFQFFLAWEENDQLCWETGKEAGDTIRWARRLSQLGLLHYMATGVATPRPGTGLWSLALRHNLLKCDHSEPFSYMHVGMNLPNVSRYEVKRTILRAHIAKASMALRSGRVNLRLVPGVVWKHLTRLHSGWPRP